MSLAKKIARRSFLIGSAAVAGGVAFGVHWYRSQGPNPVEEGLAAGEAAITPYVKITSDGITLITPRADKGQGAYSVQAALIAEELDVELDQVTVDPGVPSPVYYNTAFAEEMAPYPATDHSAMAETTRDLMDVLIKAMGLQMTGGSTTVPDSFVKLRAAGAVARETLKRAAAQQNSVAVADLKTEKGAVILPSGKRIAYTELAQKASEIRPASRVALRDPSQWRLVGKPMQRIDIAAKSTGTQDYGIDFRAPDMLHATIKMNPRQSGGYKSFDASAAEAMPGIKKVVGLSAGIAIVADNTWRAFQAAEALEVEWEQGPFPPNQDQHWQVLADSFTPERQDSQNLNLGNMDEALASGPILTAEYKAPYVAHAPLEPISAAVKVSDDRVDVWTGTQVPRDVEEQVAKVTGIDRDKVHVHVQMMGGSFGHRLSPEVAVYAAELAKDFKGQTVQMTFSREEDMTHDYVRQIAMARMSGKTDGKKVDSYDLGICMPSILNSNFLRSGSKFSQPDATITASAWDQPYSIPNYRMTAYRAPELAPIAFWRAVGASTNAFFHEGFLDELIVQAGADPMEERLRLMWHDKSRKTLEAVADMSNWGADLGPNRGRGVAFTLCFGVSIAQVVEVTNTPDGIKIDNVYVAAEVGKVIDPVNFESQVSGGVVWGLGHAMNCEITWSDGMMEQQNYDSHEAMRLYQCPNIVVRGLENGYSVKGVGEPPVAPAAPALANAIFDATGTRLREMPFNKFVDFI